MASLKDLQSISLTNTFLDKPRKHKKNKDKNPKKEKSDKPKSKAKSQQSLTDFTDIRDAELFAEWLRIRRQEKINKKKNADVALNRAFPLTQNKNLKLSRRHKQKKKRDCALGERGVCTGSAKPEALPPLSSPIRKTNKQKKRVVFNLSPVLLEPAPVVKDGHRPQHFSDDKKPSFNATITAGGHYGKPAAEGNATESQSTTDDINSQDLFITQKTFFDPFIDLCSSTSPEEAGERQGFTETHPGNQSNKELSAKICASLGTRAYAEPSPWKQLCPEHKVSSAKKRSSPEPGCHTATHSKHQSPTSRKRVCPKHQSFIASSASKGSLSESRSSSSSSRKQSYPEPPSPKSRCCAASRPEPKSLPKKPPCPSPPPMKPIHSRKLNVSTQTENFFTLPLLATSLRFHQRSPCTEEPLDLSLPRRSRLHQNHVLGDQRHTEPNVTEPVASDDSDSHSKCKADMSQLKTVQMRLNESFFFKLKGEGESPKPVSPLMKFTGSAEKKKS